jgi:hypothetical protein
MGHLQDGVVRACRIDGLHRRSTRGYTARVTRRECREIGEGCQSSRTRRTSAALTRSAYLHTDVKEILTLLVKSKTRGTAVLPTMFKDQRHRGHVSGDTDSQGVGD